MQVTGKYWTNSLTLSRKFPVITQFPFDVTPSKVPFTFKYLLYFMWTVSYRFGKFLIYFYSVFNGLLLALCQYSLEPVWLCFEVNIPREIWQPWKQKYMLLLEGVPKQCAKLFKVNSQNTRDFIYVRLLPLLLTWNKIHILPFFSVWVFLYHDIHDSNDSKGIGKPFQFLSTISIRFKIAKTFAGRSLQTVHHC